MQELLTEVQEERRVEEREWGSAQDLGYVRAVDGGTNVPHEGYLRFEVQNEIKVQIRKARADGGLVRQESRPEVRVPVRGEIGAPEQLDQSPA
ncbi:hypothetical protein GCM10023063_26670 [Arthrobacter methylotrophus]